MITSSTKPRSPVQRTASLSKITRSLSRELLAEMIKKAQLEKDRFVEALVSKAITVPSTQELTSLSDYLGNHPVVLLGGASYGTSDFYRMRQHLSRDLIEREHPEVKFRFIALEGDWAACHVIHLYVTAGKGKSAKEILQQAFHHWPTWIWANEEVAEFTEWLKEYNSKKAPGDKVGVFGLDVYSFYESLAAVVEEIQQVDPELAKKARKQYTYLADRLGAGGDYSEKNSTSKDPLLKPEGLVGIDAMVNRLKMLLTKRILACSSEDTDSSCSPVLRHILKALKSAAHTRAEDYYQSLVLGDAGTTWNLRECHMADTLQLLLAAYKDISQKPPAAKSKLVPSESPAKSQDGCMVWTHNTHVGDNRHCDMALKGDITLGGMLRRHLSEKSVCLVGFGTYRGTVVAARDGWGDEPMILEVPPGVTGSFDDLMHQVSQRKKAPAWYTIFRDLESAKNLSATAADSKDVQDGPTNGGHVAVEMKEDLRKEFGELRASLRTMGAVYDPRCEILSNYLPCQVASRYDAMVFVHTSKALKPIGTKELRCEVHATFPSGDMQ